MTTKFKAGETAGTYIANAPLTEHDILTMAKQLASRRLRKGRPLHHPTDGLQLWSSWLLTEASAAASLGNWISD